MTQYLNKSFGSPANSKLYVDNWDRIFGESVVSDSETPQSDDDSDDEPTVSKAPLKQ